MSIKKTVVEKFSATDEFLSRVFRHEKDPSWNKHFDVGVHIVSISELNQHK
jgi:hypothetical protein